MDERNFEELQMIGTKVVLHKIRAISFPEINFIHDLIFNYQAMADDIDVTAFEEVKAKV